MRGKFLSMRATLNDFVKLDRNAAERYLTGRSGS